MVLSNTVHGGMGGELNEQMGVGQYWVCFHVDKEYGGKEDEVIYPNRPKKHIEIRLIHI